MTGSGTARRPALRAVAGWRGAALGMLAVAWGANQFVSMLVAYHQHRGFSTATNDGLFGIYAVGLITALLLGGPAADRWGRPRLVRPAVVVSLVATVLLMTDSLALLYAGRFVAGAASGVILAAGTAWIKELSDAPYDPDSAEGAGAQRAAVALSLGFGLGPLVTGIVAQWAPAPLITAYVPHLLVGLIALPAVWSAPPTTDAAASGGPSFRRRLRTPSARQPRFLGVVLPAAPWVFAGPSAAFAVLPSLVSGHTHGYGVVFGGLAAGVTLGVGVAVQPVARRLDRPGEVRISAVGLASTGAALLVSAVTAGSGNPVLALVACVLFGAGYGLNLVGGLLETQRLAGPDDLAGLTAVYYALTYVGFVLPIGLAWLSAYAGYPVMFCGLAALVVCSAVIARVQSGRYPSPG
jgi:hypothetical protein